MKKQKKCYIYTRVSTAIQVDGYSLDAQKDKFRQNNTIPGFSSGFVKSVLDNPVYMGEIAYGRRRTEKKIGTRNEMHIVEQDEYPIYDGHHEAIISESDWQLAQEKRKANNFKCEKVCLLSKLSEAKHHIEVKVDMDELDLTSAEAKATYKEIQDWVQEKYGFHVTNLNIAQVKQKHGIIERENYNKTKTPDSKQPGCPSESPISEADLNATNDMPPTNGRGRYICEDKIKAIEDAMRNFQMI